MKSQMWVEECGQVFCLRGLFQRPSLQLIDPVAMTHILGSQHAYSFPKPASSQEFLLKFLGPGLVSVEGDVHRHQRRIVSPAFSTSAIKDLTPLFFRHANRIRKRFEEMVDQTTGPAKEPMFPGQTPPAAQESKEKQPVIDVSFWLSVSGV
jgi:cytochrome P450